MRLDTFKTRSKAIERNWRISEEGALRSKGAREFPKRFGEFRKRSKLLERNQRIFQNKEQTARKILESLKARSKPLEKELESFGRRSKPLERD